MPTKADHASDPMTELHRLKSAQDFRGALRVADAILQTRPGWPTAIGQKAHLLHLAGRTDEGLQILAEARTRVRLPDFVEAVEAELLWAAGRRDEASPLVDRLLRNPDLSDAALRRLLEVLHAAGEDARCDALLPEFTARARDRRDALLFAARVAREAEPWLSRAIHEFPNDPKVLEAVAAARLANLPAAAKVEELEILLSLSDAASNVRLQSKLGLELRKAGRVAEAADVLRKCLQAEPDNTFVAAHLGYCCKDLGDDDEAMACFEEALLGRPSDDRVRSTLFAVYRRAGATDRATAFVERFCARHSDPALSGPMRGRLRKLPQAAPRRRPEA